ncbi:MAG TPA: hypothetical protein VJ938_09635 [Acidimicrobiia bacterium]|nr:hypothetical protein [Acidimicrobiia bacterium]
MPVPAMIKLGSVALVIASLVGAFVGWVALSAVWASASLTPGAGDAAASARQLLAAADQTLTEVRSTLEVVGSVTDEVATQTGVAADTLDEVAVLTSERIPNALAAVESSLPALVDTAAVLEDTMQALSIIGIAYDPAVPFDQALVELQTELEGLPEAVAAQGANLAELVPDVRRMGEETAGLNDHLAAIDGSLGDAQAAVAEFGATIDDMEESTRLGASLVGVIPAARVATIVLGAAGILLGVVAWRLADRLVVVAATEPV